MQPPAPDPRQLRMLAAMQSDVGLVRARNEDAAYLDPDLQLYLVADGISGNQAGDVASSMTVDLVRQRVEASRAAFAAFAVAASDERRRQLKAILATAVREAHQALRDRGAREPDKHGMGTTLEVAIIAGREVLIAHVGDSRTYLVRRGLACQLTRDHTMGQVLVTAGELTPDEASSSPMASVIVNAVGATQLLTVDVVHLELHDGDRLLLCSDGLYDHFSRDELAERLAHGTPDERLDQLVELARARGGHDNITGIVIEATATGLPLTARPPGQPPPVPTRVRRTLAAGTAPPRSAALPVPDPWEEETTLPRTPPEESAPAAPVSVPPPKNPLAKLTDDTLGGFVEYSLYEESRPHDVPIEPSA